MPHLFDFIEAAFLKFFLKTFGYGYNSFFKSRFRGQSGNRGSKFLK